MSANSFHEPGRRTPAQGVHLKLSGPNWVFLTVCTDKRERWLAQPSVQRVLHDIWLSSATAWLVSDYLLMPDHLHLFCAPGIPKPDAQTQDARQRVPTEIATQRVPADHAKRPVTSGRDDLLVVPNQSHASATPNKSSQPFAVPIERWLAFWKDRFAKIHSDAGKFQRSGFHHRLRNGESYAAKWQYVRENPVRAGLVATPEDWPYHGRVHEIQF